MALSTQPYKGARDFYPQDKRIQKYMFGVMRSVAERYGYEEYDAPILEPLELYMAKTGEEIVNEQTYTFEDRGGRKVVIRPEMTPTVSRMVAGQRQELAYPLRWYSIPNLWRYERPQKGRLREHWQLNVDVFGIKGLEAETEVIQVADAIFKAYGATPDMYKIKISSRKLIDYIVSDFLKLSEVQAYSLMKLMDHMHKIEHAAFIAEIDSLFTPSQREADWGKTMLDLLNIKELSELPEPIKSHESVKELTELMDQLTAAGITNAEFDISVVRGFDYYSGIVFEVYDEDPENNRSMFGGGRYDGLVGLFGVEPVPTVGFGMGDVTLRSFLELHGLLPVLRPEVDVYVVIIGDVVKQAQKVVKELREMRLNVAVDLTGSKTDKQIKTAVKKGIHYVLFIGEKEIESEQYTLKNLQTGEEEAHSTQRLVSMIKDYRRT